MLVGFGRKQAGLSTHKHNVREEIPHAQHHRSISTGKSATKRYKTNIFKTF